MWKAKVIVTYKPGILDPEAKTIQHALQTLGYSTVEQLQAGRYFEVTFGAAVKKAAAQKQIQEIGTRILSNPVIQQFDYTLEECTG